MDGASVQKASDMLTRCWREGRVIDALPSPLRPSSRAGGYAIQAKVEAMSEKPLFGWKIAATSLAGQKHIGVDGPLAGRLLAERVYGDDDEIRLGANRMRVAECEFAFRMGRDLPPRDTPYEREDVLDAVADLHLAIEVPELALRRLRDGRRTADHRRQRLRSPFCLGPTGAGRLAQARSRRASRRREGRPSLRSRGDRRERARPSADRAHVDRERTVRARRFAGVRPSRHDRNLRDAARD